MKISHILFIAAGAALVLSVAGKASPAGSSIGTLQQTVDSYVPGPFPLWADLAVAGAVAMFFFKK